MCLLNDGATKIFLNTNGTEKDISKELGAFLDYVAGKESDDSFVQKLAAAVKEAKKNRKWRLEFMTLFMRDQENIEKGRKEGRKEGRREGKKEGRKEGIQHLVSTLRDFAISDEVILQKIQEKFQISKEEAKKFL